MDDHRPDLLASNTGFLSFEGRVDEDVTLFLRDFKRLALLRGRQQDEEWIADQMEASLAGSALRWYLTLETRKRRDFESLRIAMLKHFPPPVHVPSPPAAAPMALTHTASQLVHLCLLT